MPRPGVIRHQGPATLTLFLRNSTPKAELPDKTIFETINPGTQVSFTTGFMCEEANRALENLSVI